MCVRAGAQAGGGGAPFWRSLSARLRPLQAAHLTGTAVKVSSPRALAALCGGVGRGGARRRQRVGPTTGDKATETMNGESRHPAAAWGGLSRRTRYSMTAGCSISVVTTCGTATPAARAAAQGPARAWWSLSVPQEVKTTSSGSTPSREATCCLALATASRHCPGGATGKPAIVRPGAGREARGERRELRASRLGLLPPHRLREGVDAGGVPEVLREERQHRS